MIMHRHRQSFLGVILSNAMPVQMRFNIIRLGHAELRRGAIVLGRKFLVQDAFAKGDAIVADINARPGNQLLDLRV